MRSQLMQDACVICLSTRDTTKTKPTLIAVHERHMQLQQSWSLLSIAACLQTETLYCTHSLADTMSAMSVAGRKRGRHVLLKQVRRLQQLMHQRLVRGKHSQELHCSGHRFYDSEMTGVSSAICCDSIEGWG